MNPRGIIALLLFAAVSAVSSADGGIRIEENSIVASVDGKSVVVGRLYDLERLAEPPAKGERSGNWSSWDRGARYNEKTGRYENWHANRDGGGFIRREGGDIVAAEMKGPGVIWRVWSALPKAG